MSFEVFVRPAPQGRPLAHPSVAVGKGILHLNTKARQALGNPERVMLLRDGKDIAFRPAGATTKSSISYAVTNGNISCRDFIREAALEPREKLALHLEDGMLRTVGRE